MLAVIKDLVSVQMIASLGGDVKPLALSPSSSLSIEGEVKEPTLLCEKSRGRRPRRCGLPLMGGGDCHGPAVTSFTLLR